MSEPERFTMITPTHYVRVRTTVRGRELPWLSKIVTAILLPFFRWRAKRWERRWRPDLDRIKTEVAAELPGGRANPEYQTRYGERVAAWFDKHPEAYS